MRSVLNLSDASNVLPVNTYVVASEGWISQIEASMGDSQRVFEARALPIDKPLPADILGVAELLVIEIDPKEPASLARVEQVRAARPNMPLIAAVQDADIRLVRTLLRQGVADVATLPFDFDELFGEIMDASAARAERGDVALAPMATVVRAVGGVGATTVITHLASALAADGEQPLRCCVIDLDLQFGEIAPYFGASVKTDVLELLEAGGRLDSDMICDAAVEAREGVFLLGAPGEIAPIEDIDVEKLLRLLTLAREEFDFVLLDFPANWTNWTLSAALACSHIHILTDQSINSLKQAKRCIEMFDSVDVPAGQVKVIVNRVEKRLFQTIRVEEVGEALKREVIAALPLEKGGIATAQDQGLLLDEVHRNTAFAKEIDGLADLIRTKSAGAKGAGGAV